MQYVNVVKRGKDLFDKAVQSGAVAHDGRFKIEVNTYGHDRNACMAMGYRSPGKVGPTSER